LVKDLASTVHWW